MIGSSGVGYFDRWGLAGPAHVLLVVGLLVVLALALVRNQIPVWIADRLDRSGTGGPVVRARLAVSDRPTRLRPRVRSSLPSARPRFRCPGSSPSSPTVTRGSIAPSELSHRRSSRSAGRRDTPATLPPDHFDPRRRPQGAWTRDPREYRQDDRRLSSTARSSSSGSRPIAVYIVILWLASAYWAFRDMQLRTANPILPYLAAA